MGYCVQISIGGVTIPAENVEKCLAAINALHTKDAMRGQASGGSSNGERWYAWCSNPGKDGFKSLVEAFEAWRYGARATETLGGVSLDYFRGEKWGDDEILYETIAPFVKSPDAYDGTIECLGEDGCQWRYIFKDGEMRREDAKITWE